MKNKRRNIILSVIFAICACMAFGTEMFAEESVKEETSLTPSSKKLPQPVIVISLIMEGATAAMEGAQPTEAQLKSIENFEAGVNGVKGKLIPMGEVPLSRTFNVGQYNKNDTYYISYEEDGKTFSYKFKISPEEVKKAGKQEKSAEKWKETIEKVPGCRSNTFNNDGCLLVKYFITLKETKKEKESSL